MCDSLQQSCVIFFLFNNLLHGTQWQTVVATFVTTYNRCISNMELKRKRKGKEKRKEKKRRKGKRKRKRKQKENNKNTSKNALIINYL